MLNAKDNEICANSDTFTPKASGLKHKSWPAIFRWYTVLFVEVRYSWRLTLWPFWVFPQKKLLCRHSKVLFNTSLFSNNLWLWETAHVWRGLTSDFNRRVPKTDTASGSKKGSQHKVSSTCIPSNGRQGVTFLVVLKSTQPQNSAWLLLYLTSVHFPFVHFVKLTMNRTFHLINYGHSKRQNEWLFWTCSLAQELRLTSSYPISLSS